MDPQVVPISTNIIVLVLAMVLWALAFVRLAFGFRTIADTKSGIQVPWIQIGWVVFAWAFLIASFWPVIDVLLQEEWFFSDLLLMVIGLFALPTGWTSGSPSAIRCASSG